jgi:dethiobiotin synthetase
LTVVAIAGTGTDVGKTYVTAALVRALTDRGVRVAARKPVQSFAPSDTTTDADVLGAASGEDPQTVCPNARWLGAALAPPMAADALGLEPFTIADLVGELARPDDAVVFVESVGGVRSPIADDGDSAALIGALSPALVILVADASLGAINAVRLAIAALDGAPVVVFCNRFDPDDDVHGRNVEWLRTREGLEVITDLEALTNRCIRL